MEKVANGATGKEPKRRALTREVDLLLARMNVSLDDAVAVASTIMVGALRQKSSRTLAIDALETATRAMLVTLHSQYDAATGKRLVGTDAFVRIDT